ncbi:alcohol dehydrogenase catalytic domain-containing protein [Streptomyces sp. NPDC086010]|uniref:alcohol dehydrogenase catalytic domain-containing protein n=1 Tax=Streptomyces sp. NPDC086010 TaxID=3365745 RepID=UPI0037D85F28
MRAIIVGSSAGQGVASVEHLPHPEPAAGQVRIKMAGAAVNPADLHALDGFAPALGDGRPRGLGLDVSGVVDAVGADAHGLTAGMRVAAMTFPHAPHSAAGAAAEYVIVPAADVAPVPDGLGLLDAATVPLNSLTADQLITLLGPSRGRTLLVTGAAGGLGGYAVALAALAGWSVTGLARASDADFLVRAGAKETITALEGVTGFDAVLDAARLNGPALDAVRDQGTYAGVFPGAEPPAERGVTVVSAVVVPDGERLREMLRLTAEGRLEARRAGAVPLTEAATAYRVLREGGSRGRWVLTP